MTTFISKPSLDILINQHASIENGGTGAGTAEEALQNLHLIGRNDLGADIAAVGQNGYIPNVNLGNNYSGDPCLKGPLELYIGQTIALTITNYDSRTSYVLSAVGGATYRVNDVVYFTGDLEAGSAVLMVNGKHYDLIVSYPPVTLSAVSTTLARNASVDVTITNYNAAYTYILTALNGSVSRVDDVVTYTAPATAGQYGFVINGVVFNVTVI